MATEIKLKNIQILRIFICFFFFCTHCKYNLYPRATLLIKNIDKRNPRTHRHNFPSVFDSSAL